MINRIAILLLCGLLAINAASLTGSSICNSGTCNGTADCDLGVCCGGECVPTFPELAAGATCSLADLCKGVCPLGQTCQNNKCRDNVTVIGAEPSCACDRNSDCASGLCNNGTCVLVGLSTNDICIVAAQCKSNLCENGKCVGLQAGEECSDTVFSGDCAMGLVCVSQTQGSNAVCVEGAGNGESCNATVKCALAFQSCIGMNGTCKNWYSGAEGDACSTDIDCRRDLICNRNGTCQSNLNQPCGAGDARCPAPLQTCECDEDTPTCQEISPLCDSEYNAYVTCVQSKCRDTSLLDDGFPNSNQCIYSCIQQYAQWQCCSHCTNNDGATLSGLDCSGSTKKFIPPPACCNASGVCEETPGICSVGGDDDSSSVDDGSNDDSSSPLSTAGAGQDSSASGIAASAFLVVAAVVVALL